MILYSPDKLSEKILAGNKKWCPQCGTPMTETQRYYKGQTLFIWYDCPNKKCIGQSLMKIPMTNRLDLTPLLQKNETLM